MHLYIVCGTLLILLIVDFALAAPVLVQEKRQAYADMAVITTYPIAVLWKRGGLEHEVEIIENYIPLFKQEESSDAHASSSSAPQKEPKNGWSDDNELLQTIPEGWSPASSPDRASDTQSAQMLAGVHAPLSSTPVLPTWFHPGNELSEEAHASPPNTGLSNPSTVSDSDNRLVAEQPPLPKESSTVSGSEMVYPPPSPKESPTVSDFEMVYPPPSGSVPSTDPNSESMSADIPSENLQTDSYASKGQAKVARRNFDTATDVENAAHRVLQL